MKNQNDSITITWHIDDLEDIAPKLTKNQRRAVLAMVKKEHDASIGVNWDVLKNWADLLFPKHK
jgi:hypothetical protein